ncbi:MAG: nitroreductase family protein [Candidatus Bathyarchaeia archaeon]
MVTYNEGKVNRGKSTAPFVEDAQDVDVYVFLKTAAYLYDAQNHQLLLCLQGDFRSLFFAFRPPQPPGYPAPPTPPMPDPLPPVVLLLVSDTSRFKFGPPHLRLEWAAIDVGIVSQNISLYCASVGLVTRPRAAMDREKLRGLLQLPEWQYPMLNHPVGYPRKSMR